MLAKLRNILALVALWITKWMVILAAVPFIVPFSLYGLYFIGTAFLWIVLIDAAFVMLILIFTASFYMGIVALLVPSIWATIGGMWVWLWSWFSDGNIWLWPHFATSFLPYLTTGILLILAYKWVEQLNSKISAKKIDYYLIQSHK